LTETGKNQCIELGKWVRNHLKEKHNALENVNADQLKWRSSAVERVKGSGELFWKGFLNENESTVALREYEPDGSEEEGIPAADYIFRTWDSNNDYKAWTKALFGSPVFVEKSKNASSDLDGIISTLGLKQFEKFPKPVVLYGMTFAREMVDCERYYKPLSEKPMETLLSKEQLKIVDDLSLWCWNQRFFEHEFKDILAKRIVGEIKDDITNGSEEFSLYSGHDYTLLVILAGLGMPCYEKLLSFASYILIEVFDKTNANGEKERVFTLTLNFAPFEKPEEHPVEEVNENFAKNLQQPGTDSIYWKC